jgi:hypothetical protein
MRLLALNIVFRHLAQSDKEARALESSLTLGAALMWMFNALFYRPDESARYSQLAEMACWQENRAIIGEGEVENEDTAQLVPTMYRKGLYFLADIWCHGDSFRLAARRRLQRDEIALLYSVPTFSVLLEAFGVDGLGYLQKDSANAMRVRNRDGNPTLPIDATGEELPTISFNLPVNPGAYRIRAPAQEQGPDIPAEDEVTDIDEEAETTKHANDRSLTLIYLQFARDLFKKGANMSGSGGLKFDLLSTEQRGSVKPEFFKTHDFTDKFRMFRADVYKVKSWKTIFDHYFPPKNAPLKKKPQNYASMTYYRKWREMMRGLSVKDANTVRMKMWEKFYEFHWLPAAEIDRVWSTRSRERKGSVRFGYNKGVKDAPSPHIALNERFIKSASAVCFDVERNQILRNQEINQADAEDSEDDGNSGAVASGITYE